jgi:hypothetical protein
MLCRLLGKVRELIVRNALLSERRPMLVDDVLHPTPVIPGLEPGMLRVNSGDWSAQLPDMDDVLGRNLGTRRVDGVNQVLVRVGRSMG